MSRPTHSPSPSHAGADDAQQALATLRLSEEGSERRPPVNGSSTSLNGINGKGASVGLNGTPTSDVDALRQELEVLLKYVLRSHAWGASTIPAIMIHPFRLTTTSDSEKPEIQSLKLGRVVISTGLPKYHPTTA